MEPPRHRHRPRPRPRTTAAVVAGLTALLAIGSAAPAAAVATPGDPAWPQLDGLLDREHLRAHDVVVDPDGRIVTAAQTFRETEQATEAVIALAAYTRQGAVDPSFGASGVAFVNANPKVGTTGDEQATGVAVDPFGGYVAVGTTPQEELGFVVAHFDADGNVDAGFGGGDGFVVDDLGGFVQRAEAVAVDQQGRFVVVGTFISVTAGVPSGIAVARYDRDGSRDTSFGGDGVVVVDVGVTPAGNDLIVQPDDSVIVAGRGGQDAVAVHLLEDGTPNPRFGTGGIARVDLGGAADEATGIVQQGVRGRIVLAGSAAAGAADIAVAGLTPRGELDATFGTGGRSTIGGDGVEHGTDLALDEDCGLVVSALADGDVGVARFTADGDVDGEWAPDGLLRFDTGVHDGATDQDQGNTIAVDPVGGAYVVGGSGGNASLFLHRIAGSDGVGDRCPSPFGEGPLFAIGNDVEEPDRGSANAVVSISMDPPPAGSTAIDWEARPVTADEADFEVASGSLTLDNESTGLVVEIPVFGDVDDEGDETFEVRAEVRAGPAAGAQAVATVTILDEDEPGEAPPPAPTPPAEEGCPSAEFVDVPLTNVHRGAIDCLVELGVISGTTPTTFDPAGSLTRAQAAALLQRIVVAAGTGVPSAAPDAFTDDDGSVHEIEIDEMAAMGIVTGRADGTFGPNDPVRRDQFVSFLVRAHRAIEGEDLTAGPDAFDDDDDSVHEAAIDAAAAAGWVTGTGDRRFDPATDVRRDQAASFLHRLWRHVDR